MKISTFFITVSFILLFTNCHQTEYEYKDAIVDKASYNHWGRGYYKLKVFYSFKLKDKIYNGEDYPKDLYRPTGKWKRYDVGDTIIIKFPKGCPEQSSVYGTRKKIKRWNRYGEVKPKADSSGVIKIIPEEVIDNMKRTR